MYAFCVYLYAKHVSCQPSDGGAVEGRLLLWNEPATPRELPEQRPGQWGRRDALGETGNQRGFLSYLRPFYPTWDHELEERLVKQFDLPLDRKLKHLSRGMRMKAALASALAFRPKLIVLDEPFSGLDPLVRDEHRQAETPRRAEDRRGKRMESGSQGTTHRLRGTASVQSVCARPPSVVEIFPQRYVAV